MATPFLPHVRNLILFLSKIPNNPFSPYVATPFLPYVRDPILFFQSPPHNEPITLVRMSQSVRAAAVVDPVRAYAWEIFEGDTSKLTLAAANDSERATWLRLLKHAAVGSGGGTPRGGTPGGVAPGGVARGGVP